MVTFFGHSAEIANDCGPGAFTCLMRILEKPSRFGTAWITLLRRALHFPQIAMMLRRPICLIVLLGAALSCASNGTRPGQDLPDDPDAVSLTVQNDAIWDVRIFVVRGVQRIRLGMVLSTTTSSFRIASSYLTQDLVFYAEAIGASAHQQTAAVTVKATQDVKLTLEKRLRSYDISVR